MIKVGINGFGRMGRLGFRVAWDEPSNGFEIVHVNERHGTSETAAHLLEFDSVHGRWDRDINVPAADSFTVAGRRIGYSTHDHPSDINWRAFGVDVVVESSGAFRTQNTLQPHLDTGAKKVVVAAPVKEGALNIVMGCNDHLYEPAEHDIVTAASCTTNCIAPVVDVIHKTFGIAHGLITTIHDVTNTQVVVDKPHTDLRRARSALTSLIPTSTGSATAITMIYPELKGKLNGVAVRVPLLNASLADCVFELSKSASAEEINAVLREAANGRLSGILGFEERPLVSADYTNDPRSGIVDGLSTMVTDGTMVKLLVWYDNEWGYANRMMELVAKVASSLSRAV